MGCYPTKLSDGKKCQELDLAEIRNARRSLECLTAVTAVASFASFARCYKLLAAKPQFHFNINIA